MRFKIFLITGLALLGFCRTGRAGTFIYDSPIIEVNPSTGTYCQSISTSAFTQVPPQSLGNFARRNGLYVLNLPGNSANMGGVINSSFSVFGLPVAPSTNTITSFDLLYIRGAPQNGLILGDQMYLWLISLNTSAETACWQEYRQR